MNRQNEVYPYNGILFGNKKKWSPDTGTNLITIMPSESSQSQRTTDCMIPFILSVQIWWNIIKTKSRLMVAWHWKGASRVAVIKNPAAMQEMWVRTLGREDPWRRKWQPLPVFLPGTLQGQRSLADYSPQCHKESEMTEHTCTQISPTFEMVTKIREAISY